jgi:hypothetical protein
MSFDIYLQTGQGKTLERVIVERAFAKIAIETKSDWWRLHDSLAEVSISATPMVDGFAVHRPPEWDEFWAAIFEVLQSSRTYLVWPAPGPGPTYCVGPELTGHMGDPPLVSRSDQISPLIDASFG